MKKKEFKEKLFAALSCDIDNLSFDEKMNVVSNLLIEFEKENEDKRDISKKGQKWADEELKIILSDAPTKANCVKYARIFKRGYVVLNRYIDGLLLLKQICRMNVKKIVLSCK